MKHFLQISLLVLFIFICINAYSQQKRTNWLQEKNQTTARWRVGGGIILMEPTGIDVQFYRLSKFCTNNFSIIKKLSIGVWVGKEGILSQSMIKESEIWESSGIRYGIDFKFYIPIFLNPYFGIGVEGGDRKLLGKSGFYPDAVARIGVEQRIFGIKTSNKSSLNTTIFIDGKYNKCLTDDFYYILPSAGLRFHFL
ncbi:MAG: hypothetical protein A2W99_11140 [Bacteroidetes bacterium GWF2_33_16]|nr:MAG: hypothetical protein A2W99_11140 [Bacteroidetes bacterium GWF2_33_16]